jgi:hypothetical protein
MHGRSTEIGQRASIPRRIARWAAPFSCDGAAVYVDDDQG